ncbi:MAG: RNA polymerase sigma factor [Syntrophothermus sp.]
MIYFSDAALLQGLKERKSDSLKQLYREFHPIAKSIVERNSGSRQDVEDVFQDSIIILYQKIAKNDVKINCSLKTFFYSICRNIWKQRLDRKWRLVYQDDMVNEPAGEYEIDAFRAEEKKLEKLRILYTHLEALPVDCQTIITLFMGGMPLKEIARITGLKDDNYVKTRKYLCKNMLRKKIIRDPQFKNVFQNE